MSDRSYTAALPDLGNFIRTRRNIKFMQAVFKKGRGLVFQQNRSVRVGRKKKQRKKRNNRREEPVF